MGLKELKNFLQKHGIEVEITRHAAPIRSTTQAALAVNLPPENLVKTILLKGENNTIIACIIPKHAKLNEHRVQAILNWEKAPKIVDYLEIKKITGFNPGGLPPIGLPENIPILIEEEILAKDIVACTAVNEFHMMKIPVEAFKKVPNEIFVDKIIE